MSNVIVIGAHADDIEIGCTAAIRHHIANGDDVTYLCMTSGQSIDGVTKRILRSKDQSIGEVEEACKILGVSEFIVLDNKDLHLQFSFDNISEVQKIFDDRHIDTMYTHFYGDANQDHIATYRICMAAGRYIPRVLCYEQIPIPRLSHQPFNGNFYIPYTDFDIKKKAISCHKSQVEKYIDTGYDMVEYVKIRDTANGLQAGGFYAERFEVIKYTLWSEKLI